MELKDLHKVIEIGGVELIKARLKAAILNHNLLDMVNKYYPLLTYDACTPEYKIIKDNLDELKKLPGIWISMHSDYVIFMFNGNASIDTWEPYMISKLEECVYWHMINSWVQIGHNDPLGRSIVDYLIGMGFRHHENGDYTIVYP